MIPSNPTTKTKRCCLRCARIVVAAIGDSFALNATTDRAEEPVVLPRRTRMTTAMRATRKASKWRRMS